MVRHTVLALALSLPLPAVAGGPPELYASEPGCECTTMPRPQRHTHEVRVELGEEPLTEGVDVAVSDAHAGVHVVVRVGVTLPEEEEP